MTINKYTPQTNCDLCIRLKNFRDENRIKFPDKFNAPVPWFGSDDPKILIVGLAPGLKGANFSGRPFTGDYAGDLLYSTLLKYGMAKGTYKASFDDGLELIDCRITNAVKCVPPENKPTGEEINICNRFLKHEIENMKNLKAVLALGKIAHDSVLKATGMPKSKFVFGHGKTHKIGNNKLLHLVDSYHCSRYNTQTKRLTEKMFHEVFEILQSLSSV